jgi:hypothetical protein
MTLAGITTTAFSWQRWAGEMCMIGAIVAMTPLMWALLRERRH